MNKFLSNKYTTWYYAIIDKYRDTAADSAEVHHIIPRALGGDDSPSNLAVLPLRVHCLCHLLLIKMTTGKAKHKMVHSINLMTNTRDLGLTARQYAIRKRHYYEMLADPEYKALMSIARKAAWTDEAKQRMRVFQLSQWSDDSYKLKMSSLSKDRWSDPAYKERLTAKHKERCSTDEFKQKQSDFFKSQWLDSNYREHMTNIVAERWKDESYRAKKLERLAECWSDADYQSNQTEKQKAVWADPEHRAARIENQKRSWTPERRKKHSDAIKAATARGAYKVKS